MYNNQNSKQNESNLNKYYFIKLSLFAPVLGLAIWSAIRTPFSKYNQFDFKFQRLNDENKTRIRDEFKNYSLLFKSIEDSEKKVKNNGIYSLNNVENFYYNLGRQVRFIDKKLDKNDINNGEIMFGYNFNYVFSIIIKYEQNHGKIINDFFEFMKNKQKK